MTKQETSAPAAAPPSSNWLKLQKTISTGTVKRKSHSGGEPARKRRKIERDRDGHHGSDFKRGTSETSDASVDLKKKKRENREEAAVRDVSKHTGEMRNGESLDWLRRMIAGKVEYTDNQQQPGKYLALDCEMVGVGLDGSESSLARVSLVNYYGVVVLDEFVRQRERVVDYRTEWSGIRPSDMVHAKPFEEVQKKVAELLDGKILVGHAVFNDLKALLLSHPRPLTRDTQHYAAKYKVTKSKYPALRNLVKQELDVVIQGGEHSSVTDARATMAVYRLHRREWEKGQGAKLLHSSSESKGKRKHETDEGEGEEEQFPGGGRKRISSGLSVVVKRADEVKVKANKVEKKSKSGSWWKELNGGGAKGSIRIKSG